MRRKRFSSYRSRKRRTTFPYLLTAFMCVALLMNLDVAPTQSVFTGQAQSDADFKAASSFWDKSSLRFVGASAESGVVAAVVKNAGSDMRRPVAYEVYWSAKGNPKNGERVSSGELRTLAAGETDTLTYQTQAAGNYMFKLYQSSGHPGTGFAWSDAITVKKIEAAEAAEAAKDGQEKNADEPTPSPSASPTESPAVEQPPSTEPAPAAETPPPAQETPTTTEQTPPGAEPTSSTDSENSPAAEQSPSSHEDSHDNAQQEPTPTENNTK